MPTLTMCHGLEQNFLSSRLVLRGRGVTAVQLQPFQCLEPRVFWVEQRLNSRLLWEGLVTLNFKNAAFVVVLMLLPFHALDGQSAVGRPAGRTAAQLACLR